MKGCTLMLWGGQGTTSPGLRPCLAEIFLPLTNGAFYLKVCLLALYLLGDCNTVSFPSTDWRRSITFTGGSSGVAFLALQGLLGPPSGMNILLKDLPLSWSGHWRGGRCSIAPSHLLHLFLCFFQWCYLVLPCCPSERLWLDKHFLCFWIKVVSVVYNNLQGHN